ncbi:Oidioi.mRNA.OKI2018_I69.PAR.g9492.t1.cds [Oikopleura dioica]|uniref:Oidioi.mRNA.OKI2018_I69.PAR.g9492.t1.cds n=1 Tax=Oikopleura dioica TaxID=34765 RepID=A0ABN7RQ11_OIKDI|nr:Oidioi.mRNA.OKI2018_I69.PAR.g9492.t1.cds [Oikopleura dioica]
MISYFSCLFLVVSGSRKDDIQLGLMISKSLMASVPNDRPPMSFQMGLKRRGRAFSRQDTDQLCYLNKIKHDMDTVVDDFICGNDLTRRYLVDNVCGRGQKECFECNSKNIKIDGPAIEAANCIAPVISHYDHATKSHICYVSSTSFGVCELSSGRTCANILFAYSNNRNQAEKMMMNYECCKAKLSDPENQMIDCIPRAYNSREYSLWIQKPSGALTTIRFPVAMPKRCCADI